MPPKTTDDRGCCKRMFSHEIVRVLVAVTLAIVVGVIMNEGKANDHWEGWVQILHFPGKLWLNGLKLLVLPLIAMHMVTAMAELKNLPNAKTLGFKTIAYYMCTTLLAACNGILMSFIFLFPFVKPIDPSTLPSTLSEEYMNKKASLGKRTVLDQIFSIFEGIVPSNILDAGLSGNLLGIISFSVCIGLMMDTKKHQELYRCFQQFGEIITAIVKYFILVTPLGVFSLVCKEVAMVSLGQILSNIGIFLACVFTGLAVHGFVVYPILFFVLTRQNPFPIYKNIFPAMFVALGTSSSAATLPVTMACAEKNGVHESIRSFVLPLGATINMDGTSIGFPCAAIFLALAQGMKLGGGDVVIIAIVSTLSSIGAAPIPSSGLVLLILILTAANIPVTSTFALILAVDWLYDRPETMINIIGDSFASVWINKTASKYLEELEDEDDDDEDGTGVMVVGRTGEFSKAITEDPECPPAISPHLSAMPPTGTRKTGEVYMAPPPPNPPHQATGRHQQQQQPPQDNNSYPIPSQQHFYPPQHATSPMYQTRYTDKQSPPAVDPNTPQTSRPPQPHHAHDAVVHQQIPLHYDQPASETQQVEQTLPPIVTHHPYNAPEGAMNHADQAVEPLQLGTVGYASQKQEHSNSSSITQVSQNAIVTPELTPSRGTIVDVTPPLGVQNSDVERNQAQSVLFSVLGSVNSPTPNKNVTGDV